MLRSLLLIALLAACNADSPTGFNAGPAAGKAAVECSLIEIFNNTCETVDNSIRLTPVPSEPVAEAEVDTSFNITLTFLSVDPIRIHEEEKAYYRSLGISWDKDSERRSWEYRLEHYSNVPDFTAAEKAAIRRAADRWEAVITKGFPDISSVEWLSPFNSVPTIIPLIDDIHIAVIPLRADQTSFMSVVSYNMRQEPFVPLMPNIYSADRGQTEVGGIMEQVALHEIGHALGLVEIQTNTPYWEGPAFISRFVRYFIPSWKLVRGHFSQGEDVMTHQIYDISALSLAVLEDKGYSVNYNAAETYHNLY